MDNQSIVRERYPSATARQHKAIYQFGRVPSSQEEWTIYLSEALGVHTLATASTEAEAWELAASGVQNAKPKNR